MNKSKYFESLFSGRWDRSKIVNLDIPDENVDAEALDIVFGSLYCDNVQVKPERAVNVSS